MFEDALFDSSPRRTSVLRRIHYLLSGLAGTLFFAQGLYLLPMLLAPAGARPLFIAAAIVGVAGALHALMLCYVWADTRRQHWAAWPWLAVTLLLNLPGFLIYLVYSAQKTGDWKRAAIPLAYVAESMLVGVLILLPLIYTQALPRQLLFTEIHIPPPPGPPPAPATPHPAAPAPHPAAPTLTPPTKIPNFIVHVEDPPEPPQHYVPAGPGVIGAPAGFPSGGPTNWVMNSLLGSGEAPAPPPAHAAPRPQIIRLPSVVVAAKAVYQPKPDYPPLAIIAHVQGRVVLQAIIGKDGAIQDLKVLSGHPLLVPAAVSAVKVWRYQPTLLNSEPVEVLTEIDVIFNLGQ
jgi:protein TonB